jgi:hypothetical protein
MHFGQTTMQLAQLSVTLTSMKMVALLLAMLTNTGDDKPV